jgi:hypothetical protein
MPTPNYKLQARIWLFVVFLLLTAAHVCFYYFSVDPRNPYPLTRGGTFGCVLWSTVLVVAIWLRRGWARYLLVALICAAIGGFGVTMLLTGKEVIEPASMRMVASGLALYAIALMPLWMSRALTYYLGPRTAGE